MNEVKLLAIDLDGTLCKEHGGIYSENLKPIFDAQNKGIKVVIVTGRPIFNALEEIKKNNLYKHSDYVVAYNGACIWNDKENKVEHSVFLKKNIVKEIFDICNKNNINAWSYTSDIQKVVINASKNKFRESNFLQKDIKVIEKPKNDNDYSVESYKLLIVDDNNINKGYDLIQNIIKKHKLNFSEGTAELHEINAQHINKGIAIEWLSKKLNISLKNIIAIGNGHNDIPMFKRAGLSIAMANSADEVKKNATVVGDYDYNGGVGKAIIKYVLNNKN